MPAASARFASAFGKAIRTDIHSGHQVYQLLNLVAGSLSLPVRHVVFETNDDNYFFNGQDMVTSTPQLIRESVDNFLYADPKPAAPPSTPAGAHHRHHHHQAFDAAALDLYPDGGIDTQAATMSVDVPFPVYIPSYETGTAVPMDFHAYKVEDEQGHVHRGYRIDWAVNGDGGYYGIEGLAWANPPAVREPDRDRDDQRSHLPVRRQRRPLPVHRMARRQDPLLGLEHAAR